MYYRLFNLYSIHVHVHVRYTLHCSVVCIERVCFSGFVLEAISGYVRTKSYNIHEMEEREKEIKTKAEEIVNNSLSFPKRMLFNWLLFHARRGNIHVIIHIIHTCTCTCTVEPLYSGHLYNQGTFWSPNNRFSVKRYL